GFVFERHAHDRRVNRAGMIRRDNERSPGRLVPAAHNAKTEEHFADRPQSVFHTQVPDVGNTSGKPAAQASTVRHRQILTHASSYGRAVRCELRSEERRVGKECRCRWWACQSDKEGDKHVESGGRSSDDRDAEAWVRG